MNDIARLRLIVQGVIALAVLACGTYLAAIHTLDAAAVAVLFGAALGAVGSGAVGGTRAPTPPPSNGANGGST